MEDREVLLKQVRRAYKARDTGALEDMMAECHPDVVFTLAGDRNATQVLGSMCGHPQVKDALAKLIDTFEFAHRNILTELVDNDRVAVRSRLTVRSCPTNMTRETEILDLFRIQDGKIVELIEFADTALIQAMVS
ncbi:nuclear transport factor 2 family protein [Bradyrhizobium oligotrophicum S58]